jgi:hypothetical protein
MKRVYQGHRTIFLKITSLIYFYILVKASSVYEQKHV